MTSGKRGFQKGNKNTIECVKKRNETRRKNGWWKNPEETKRKMRKLHKVNVKGENNPFYGKHHSKKSREKMKIAHTGKKRSEETKRKMRQRTGKKASNWKGDKAKKKQLHAWVKKHKTPSEVCEICGERKPLQLANIRNHVYTRNPDDYRWYCVKCHRKRDIADEFFKNFKRNSQLNNGRGVI